MKTQSLTIVLLRIVAVWVIAQDLLYVAEFFGTAYQTQSMSGNIAIDFSISVAAPLAIGFIMWAVAPYIAALAVRNLPLSIEMGGLTAEGLANAAFVVMGVGLVAVTLPSLVAFLFQTDSLGNQLKIAWIAGRVLECLFGIGLIAGSRTLSMVLLRLRYAGTNG